MDRSSEDRYWMRKQLAAIAPLVAGIIASHSGGDRIKFACDFLHRVLTATQHAAATGDAAHTTTGANAATHSSLARQAKTKAEAYRLDSIDEIDKDYIAAFQLVERVMQMDMWPTDRLELLSYHLAAALQAFPEEEHAMRLAYAMNSIDCCHNVDVLSFNNRAARHIPSIEEMAERFGVPADRAEEREASRSTTI